MQAKLDADKFVEGFTFVVKQQGKPAVDPQTEQGVMQKYQEMMQLEAKKEIESAAAAEDEYDEMYDQAVAIVTETQQASISMIQRRLRVGYNRAARMIEQMERDGVVGPADGAKPREVYARKIEA